MGLRSSIILLSVVLAAFPIIISSFQLEKIFVHDRGSEVEQVKKTARLEDTREFELFRRALEEFKENVPQYTGYFFLDLMFEVFKSLMVFIFTLLVPANSDENSLNFTNSTNPAIENSVE